jgi:hypothetical protein
MKRFRSPFTITALRLTLIFILMVQLVSASSQPAPAPVVDRRKLIQSVNAASDMVVIVFMRDNSTRAYTLDDLTTIQVNHVPAKIADIKSGMQVRDFIERDGQTLDSLTVDKADPAPAKAK